MGYVLFWREISAAVTKHEVFPSSNLKIITHCNFWQGNRTLRGRYQPLRKARKAKPVPEEGAAP